MIVGIDLGTTNSLIGVWRNGQTQLIPNALGHVLTPSVVGIGYAGELLVGLAARERLVSHPGRTAAVFKRYMGSDRSFDLAGRAFRPEELSALVLGALKADAEAFLGEPVTEAVITVPAYFNDVQRKATRAAGEMAGLKVDRLLTEPTAAALAYGVSALGKEQMILVADLGGGTVDVSLLHSYEGVMEVRAAAGDARLGGEDFVDVIVQEALERRAFRADRASPVMLAALRQQAELAKRRLSDADSASFEVAHGGRTLTFDLTRDAFEARCEPLLARLRAPIERAMRDARVRPEDLHQVILAGGASRMPMFRRLIARLFRRMPTQSIDPDEVVARGAAVRAGLAMRHAGLEEAILVDVTPFTLGIEVADKGFDGRWTSGLFMPIIERNTVVPASRASRVWTRFDRQKEIRIAVFQGESRFTRENLRLGELLIGVPPAPAGEQSAEVRLTVDASGLIELEARALGTDVLESLLIETHPGVLSQEEIQSRLEALKALKVPPREDADNIALMARAGRLYEQHLGEPRAAIGDAMAAFEAALASQDPDKIRVIKDTLRRVVEFYGDEVLL